MNSLWRAGRSVAAVLLAVALFGAEWRSLHGLFHVVLVHLSLYAALALRTKGRQWDIVGAFLHSGCEAAADACDSCHGAVEMEEAAAVGAYDRQMAIRAAVLLWAGGPFCLLDWGLWWQQWPYLHLAFLGAGMLLIP